jgi:hypothetical protein
VYCLSDDGRQTASITEQLRTGHSTLFKECVDAVVRRIVDHQWTVDQLPERLAPVIEAMLQRRTPAIGPVRQRQPGAISEREIEVTRVA